MQALRARFLVAMGISASAFACSKEKGVETPVPVPSASETTATATAPIAATADPPRPIIGTGRPSNLPTGGGCGDTQICNPAAAAPVKGGAKKPFDNCAATIPPGDNEMGSYGDGVFDAEATDFKRATKAAVCCYKAPRKLCGGGRPLRGDDGVVVAPAVRRDDWLTSSLLATAALPDATRAAQWLVDAAAEHASVASFARASLQLLALGAPAELVSAVHAAALDEIAHARACYALAARRGAVTNGPGPLAVDRAPLATTLEGFVRDTFLDGCVAETLAALDVRRRAEVGDAIERAALLAIADDEDRHAELAWRMLAWGVRCGGDAARAALAAARSELAPSEDPALAELVHPCAAALLDEAA